MKRALLLFALLLPVAAQNNTITVDPVTKVITATAIAATPTTPRVLCIITPQGYSSTAMPHVQSVTVACYVGKGQVHSSTFAKPYAAGVVGDTFGVTAFNVTIAGIFTPMPGTVGYQIAAGTASLNGAF
jgi:hypothetical protein